MKKFKFRLEKVLTHRRINAEIAQRNFAEAQAELHKEEDALQAMVNMKEQSIEARSKAVESTTDWANSVSQINQFLLGQDLRIKKQHQRITEIENIVESRREILRQAISEVKILERLEEKQFEKYKIEVSKIEQAEIDELNVMRFSRTEDLIKGSHEDGI